MQRLDFQLSNWQNTAQSSDTRAAQGSTAAPLDVPSLLAPILTFRFPPVAKLLELYASHSCSSKSFPISLVQVQLCID